MVECGSCHEARGFKLGDGERELLRKMCKIVNDLPNEPYYHRISLASIWGLAVGCEDDPFAALPGDEQGGVLEGFVVVEGGKDTS